jgi:hypothetical protein
MVAGETIASETVVGKSDVRKSEVQKRGTRLDPPLRRHLLWTGPVGNRPEWRPAVVPSILSGSSGADHSPIPQSAPTFPTSSSGVDFSPCTPTCSPSCLLTNDPIADSALPQIGMRRRG